MIEVNSRGERSFAGANLFAQPVGYRANVRICRTDDTRSQDKVMFLLQPAATIAATAY